MTPSEPSTLNHQPAADNAALPAAGASADWKYKAICRLDDDPARRDGQWSDEVRIGDMG